MRRRTPLLVAFTGGGKREETSFSVVACYVFDALRREGGGRSSSSSSFVLPRCLSGGENHQRCFSSGTTKDDGIDVNYCTVLIHPRDTSSSSVSSLSRRRRRFGGGRENRFMNEDLQHHQQHYRGFAAAGGASSSSAEASSTVDGKQTTTSRNESTLAASASGQQKNPSSSSSSSTTIAEEAKPKVDVNALKRARFEIEMMRREQHIHFAKRTYQAVANVTKYVISWGPYSVQLLRQSPSEWKVTLSSGWKHAKHEFAPDQ